MPKKKKVTSEDLLLAVAEAERAESEAHQALVLAQEAYDKAQEQADRAVEEVLEHARSLATQRAASA